MKTKIKKVPELRFPEFSGEWVEKRLEEILNYTQPTKFLVKNTQYKTKGIPVLTAGKTFLLGYTDENFGVYNHKLPVILFDDFTTDTKFVDFPFKLKSSAIKILNSKKNYNIKFIFEQMKNIKFKVGEHQRHWISIFSKIKICLPPTLEEQKTIAEFLSLIDKKIELNEKKLEALKKYKKGMLQKLLNVNEKGVPELRFPEFSGKWVEKKLGEVLKERKEYSKKTDDITHLTLSKDGVFPKTKQFNRDFLVVNKNKKYKITYFNDICYNPANLKFGVICRNKYGKGIFSPIYITFETYNINPVFIENIITSDTFINKALKYQEGTVYERMAVKPEDLLKLKIFIPPTLEEQKTIAEFLSLIDKKIELNEKKLEALKKYKKGLLQKMFV